MQINPDTIPAANSQGVESIAKVISQRVEFAIRDRALAGFDYRRFIGLGCSRMFEKFKQSLWSYHSATCKFG